MNINFAEIAASQTHLKHVDGAKPGEPGCICTVGPQGAVIDYDCGAALMRRQEAEERAMLNRLVDSGVLAEKYRDAVPRHELRDMAESWGLIAGLTADHSSRTVFDACARDAYRMLDRHGG